ncbi:MAG: hypothetical protein M0R51_06365 [Clostridia bacterium]|jgi:hypothetical protein|nr:hypothetical protein [Clostridia bacterium]
MESKYFIYIEHLKLKTFQILEVNSEIIANQLILKLNLSKEFYSYLITVNE